METSVFILEEFAHKNKQFPSVFAKNIFIVQISIGLCHKTIPSKTSDLLLQLSMRFANIKI